MPRLRLGRSYWLDVFQKEPPHYPQLQGGHRADIAIVGGGITGCAAALLFARAGASVVLVESQRIGRGSTAASTALLMQEPDIDFTALSERYGAARGTDVALQPRGGEARAPHPSIAGRLFASRGAIGVLHARLPGRTGA
jgi:glycine/D-amino acid oxidase-like deaminating enzyme